MIGGVILFVVIAFFAYRYYQQWNLNQEIIKSTKQKIEITQVKEMNLWDRTIKNIRDNNQYIEIKYNNYKVKLDSENLEKHNKIDIQIQNIKSKYSEWENQDILEIDVSKVIPYNILEQIELDNHQYLKGLNKIDIYGIKTEDKNIEYIETKEIQEDNTTLILRQEYEKYILVYVPIKEIKVEKEEIEIFKNEMYQMHIEIEPKNATIKEIHIEDLEEGSIIEIQENGVIQANEIGNREFEMEAEDGKVKKKIKVTVRPKVEGIQIESEKIQLKEGDSKQLEVKVLPEELENKNLNYESSSEDIAKIDANGKIEAIREGKAIITITTKAEPIQKREIEVIVQKKTDTLINSVQIHTEDNPVNPAVLDNYINGVLVVNKNYSLPSNYDPGTNPEALQAFNDMKSKARGEGISLKIVSGYRSYQTQQSIYQRNVKLYGEEEANTFSAKPGQSEHQTGLAFDINSTRWDFKDTIEAKWLAEHCYDYGFIIRYPENKQEKTGYVYEPWHIRYVGNTVAIEIRDSGLCLEEYLGI